jgi:molecular chaperone HtpG
LYSDQEIFLRELVSNAADACKKLNALSSMGEFQGELGDLRVEVKLDEKNKTITVSDNGIGMSQEEVEKYIAQIAFSGAEEFVQKYKDKADGIIGHFGLGFFSAFMVSSKVEVISKSYKDEPAAHWTCEGNPDYELTEGNKETRGTDIILHVSDDAKEFLSEFKIKELLTKYCKFFPVPVKFGTREETKKVGEGEDAKEEKITVDNIINNTDPIWAKSPVDLKDEDYKSFYRELYPMTFDDPLFHIHLNVDYPFNLTGILYFPKLKENLEVQKNKIQLYCNQVFVTDSVEGIVPDFLTLLHGVIDSPDIPLNVSRSYLQSDSNVKKISNHITKKVADKLDEMFRKEREDFEAKWDDIKVFIEYGILTDDKFVEKANKFTLYKSVIDNKYFTFEEYTDKIKDTQTNKDNKQVVLYTNDLDGHHSYIETAKSRGYDVILLDSPLSSHLVNKLEQSNGDVTFSRIDGDTIDKLIQKDEAQPSKLSKEEEEALKPVIEEQVDKQKFNVSFEPLSETDAPMQITQPEFMRRMMEMQRTGGGGFMGAFPETYNLVVNSNHPLISKILNEESAEEKAKFTKQATDLALLSQGLLKGEALTNFINRSVELI